jgi:hypothetical protein
MKNGPCLVRAVPNLVPNSIYEPRKYENMNTLAPICTKFSMQLESIPLLKNSPFAFLQKFQLLSRAKFTKMGILA